MRFRLFEIFSFEILFFRDFNFSTVFFRYYGFWCYFFRYFYTIPHQLTDEQKQERVKLCRENLAKFRDGSWRLYDIITGDETWFYHRQIHHKSTNVSWVGKDESPTTIVRRGKFEPKNLFSIFFKSNGPVLIHAVDEGKTIDHNYYIENWLKPVVKEIWKQRKSAGTKEECIIIMLHPRYSPDLVPCDYWLNDYIKRNLTDQPDEKLLTRAVSKVMKKTPKEEFKKTFD
ncbi:unnamed protein product [Rotaria sp. Silwood2]|nr:unnamed protein product [Rotaria sp. Silwood2]CAF4020617.1 unnamed protein product [Rotaria sp. Silwood2]